MLSAEHLFFTKTPHIYKRSPLYIFDIKREKAWLFCKKDLTFQNKIFLDFAFFNYKTENPHE
jgi:hypothetical protein